MRAPIIAIAGWGHTADTLGGLFGAWAAGDAVKTVATHDLAGPGQANSLGDKEGISSYAQNLLALIEEQGGAAILIGWSMGGLVALETACHRPARVKGLVLVSATPRFCAGPGYSWGVPIQNVRAMSRGLQRDPGNILQGFYRLAAEPCQEPLPAVRDQWRQTAGWIEELTAGLNYLMTIDLRAKLAQVQAPALILHGREDRVIPWQAAAAASRALPASRLGLYAGVGHDLPLREPERLTEDIRKFIRE